MIANIYPIAQLKFLILSCPLNVCGLTTSHNHNISNILFFLCSKLPSFDSVFDEETFYIFFFILVIVSCIAAYIASKFITLEDASFAEIEAKKKR